MLISKMVFPIILCPENIHYLWVRLLFLYAINALVLFDNTPLRAYDVFSKDGDLVLPKSVRETLEQVVSLENMDEPGEKMKEAHFRILEKWKNFSIS